MQLKLEEKRALVTGSTRGIGRGIATALATEGAQVVIHGRNKEEAEKVATEINDQGGKAFGVAGDLAEDRGAQIVFDSAVETLGGIDILVNNAGTFEVCGWSDADAERWQQTYNTNLLSMVRMIRLVVPGLREAGWGRIIQISSISASIAPPVFPDYGAAKAATLNLTVSLMQELAGSGVTVNTISPGPIVTETWKDFARGIAEAQGWDTDIEAVKEQLLATVMANPAGRLGEVDDVAQLCAFLASPLAGYINGANIPVTGGLATRVL